MLIVRPELQNGTFYAPEVEDMPCNMVPTTAGARPLEGLAAGHVLRNNEGGHSTVLRVDRMPVFLSDALSFGLGIKAVMIRAHAFGPELPSHDTLVSAYQRIFLKSPEIEALSGSDQAFTPAVHLTIFDNVEIYNTDEEASLINVTFEETSCLQLNNLWLECYTPQSGAVPTALEQTHEEMTAYFAMPDMPIAVKPSLETLQSYGVTA